MPLELGKVFGGNGSLIHKIGQKPRNVDVLFALVVLEDSLEHVFGIGYLLGAFVADVAH